MGFALDTGYVPSTVGQLMEIVRENINTEFGTAYTQTNFIGTNFYKYFYALIQELQNNEVKTSEIFLKMQEYFTVTNERVLRPNTTHPGIYDYFLAAGYLSSTKPPLDADAGKLYVCVDVTDNHARGIVEITSYANLVSGTDDAIQVGATNFVAQAGAATPGDATFQAATSNTVTASSLAAQINAHATAGSLVYAWSIDAKVYIRALLGGTDGNSIGLVYDDNDTNIGLTVSAATLLGGVPTSDDIEEYDDVKLEICELVKDCAVGGVVTQGTEIETIVLSNGQSMDFKFNLPNRIPVGLRLTLTQSENNLFAIGDPLDVKELLLEKIAASYKLGKNFEPQRYFSVADAPWTGQVLLEWTDDIVDGEIDGGATWSSDIYESNYDDLFEFDSALVEIVEE
jgi:hypothetical protein